MNYDDDAVLNAAGGHSFSEVVASRLSRRQVLGGGLAAAATFLAGGGPFGGIAAASPGAPSRAGSAGQAGLAGALLGFGAIFPGFDDDVHVPPGYTARLLIPWGTPVLGGFPAFVPGTPPMVAGGNSAAEQAEQIGMHHDGMHFFPLDPGPGGSRRGLLVVNHEYTDEGYLHTGSISVPAKSAWTPEMVRKSQNSHGVSVVEIARDAAGRWRAVRSASNRRITANTPMAFSGPAAGHRLLRTSADPAGATPPRHVQQLRPRLHPVGAPTWNAVRGPFRPGRQWRVAAAGPRTRAAHRRRRLRRPGRRAGEGPPGRQPPGGHAHGPAGVDVGRPPHRPRVPHLTNNTSSAKVVSAANPRKPNAWGHIIRWQEARDDHTATAFTWDLFVVAGQGRGSGDGSTVDAEDAFGSPDGIWVDPDGRVWIQTDGNQPAGANDQMLAANPYVDDAHGTPEIKRFLTGVRACEVTGVVTTRTSAPCS